MDLTQILNRVYLGNSIWKWGLYVLLLIAAVPIVQLIRALLLSRLREFARKTDTDIDDLIEALVQHTRSALILLIAAYAGSSFMEFEAVVSETLRTLAIAGGLIQIVLWANDLLQFMVGHLVQTPDRSPEANKAAATVITFVGRLVLWSVATLLVLDNIPGVEVTSLVAGLGVTGIAVALALQNVLSDLFASLSIMLDQPFIVGDFIIVDDLMGTVKHIGLKSTRIVSLFGEELIFSNSDLLNSRIHNYQKMEERRVAFMAGVIYETSAQQLADIPDIIRQTIEAQELTRFDRSHLREFGDFSLNFETVYYVLDPDYNRYMDIQHAINLEIFRRFEELGIQFAYPTQVVYVNSTQSS